MFLRIAHLCVEWMSYEVRTVHIDTGAEHDRVPRDGRDVAGEGPGVLVFQSPFGSTCVVQIGEVARGEQHQLRGER